MSGEPWVWWALAVVGVAMTAALVAIALIAWLTRSGNDRRRPPA
jgi:hypothetical protein